MSEQVDGKRGRSNLIDIVIIVLVVGLFAVAFFAPQPGSLDSFVGDPAPAFKLPRHGGGAASLGDYSGQVVVLDFWATWCQPCLRQMPRLRDAADIVGPDVAVVSINVDQATPNRSQAIDQFLERANVEIETLVDDGSVMAMYGIDTLPSLVVIDRAGTVSFASSGVHGTEDIVRAIEAARGGADG